MKKRIASFCMVLLLVVSLLPTTALAADAISITVGNATAEVGGTATVDVSIAGAETAALMSVALDFDFDSALTLTSVEMSQDAIDAGFTFGTNTLADGIIQVEGDPNIAGSSMEDGVFYTLTFNVATNANGTYDITAGYLDGDNEMVNNYNEEAVPCNFTPGAITVKTAVADGYTATMTTSASNNEVVSEGSIDVNVAVSHSSDTVFNAGEIKLTYDSTKLTPDTTSLDTMVTAGTLSGYKVNNNNELVIEDFGSDKTMPYTYSIPFTAAEVSAETTDTVTLSRAAFIHKDNASSSDLIEAAKSPESLTVTIKVAMVNVTLTNEADDTETTKTTTQKGVAYTFAPDDTANYTYSNVTATVDDNEVSVTNNGDGTFTIAAENVTGDIELTYTKTANSYNVTVIGEGTTDEEKVTLPTNKPTYNVNYVFTVPADKDAGTEAGYTYALTSITIGGNNYTGYQGNDKTYTIPGADITGDIVITIAKTEVAANTFTVSVSGDATGDATVNNENNLVSKGETASITVTPEAGYTYTVTAKMGNTDAAINNSGNTYTVSNVSANVTFTVTKTLNVEDVTVTEYVKVDNYVVYLVTYDVALADGKAPTYDGDVMFWSESYDAYCWLVIESTLDEDTAKTKIGAKSGTATKVDYGMDINDTNTTDAADAQLVWNMYNALYSDFDTVTMAQFLAADQNATSDSDANWGLNVQDAQVIIAAILAGNATT